MKLAYALLLLFACQKAPIYGNNGFLDALPFPEDSMDTFVTKHALALEKDAELTALAQKYDLLPPEILEEHKYKMLRTLRKINPEGREKKLKIFKELHAGQDSRYGLPKNDFVQKREADSPKQAISFFQQIYAEQLEDFCNKVCLFLEGKRHTKTQEGAAYEVHEYMNAAQSTQTSISVENAVLDFIKKELEQKKDFVLVSTEASILCFVDWCQRNKIISDDNRNHIIQELTTIKENHLRIIICFIFTLSDEERDAYFSTLVSESLHAFDSKKKESCTKGIEERLFTSFRALTTFSFFTELFQSAEEQYLTRIQKQNFFKQFGIDTKTQKLTKALQEAFSRKSVTGKSTLDQKIAAYNEIAKAYFDQKGIAITSDLQEEIDTFADIFENPAVNLWEE